MVLTWQNRKNSLEIIVIYLIFVLFSSFILGIEFFDFAFSENGTTAYRKGRLISQNSFIETIGEEKYTELVNYLLHYLADLNIPKKRGTFIEFRNSMINVSPIGRNCSYPEREEFEAYDKEHNIRKKLCADLEQKFPNFGLKYSIGGQISIDIFPIGWDKTYCLGHVMPEQFDEIHFFGDKTCPGGNDFEIAQDARVIAHPTQNPQETICQLKKLFLSDKK